jgi:hypothetical protein
MLKLGSKSKAIGTQVPCPACRYPNAGIYIWCGRCGAPLDWTVPSPAAIQAPTAPAPVEAPPAPEPATVLLARQTPLSTRPKLRMPAIAWPKLTVPSFTLPRLSVPQMPRLRAPVVPRIALVVAAILALLLIVPLAYMLLPAGRAAVNGQGAAVRLPSTGPTAGDAAQAAAIPGVEAKTHLSYRNGKCAANAPCLTFASEEMGKDAAAIVFSTASSATRQCVGYVYRANGSWRFLDALCGLPDQLSPLVGHDATVHVPGNCANVREAASLKAGVIACLKDGNAVHLDGGPTYADSRIWWHEPQGWIAHDFLTGP